MKRLAWLGGSFDPVHAGHLHVARAAADALQLDQVLFVLSPRPPHKLDRQQAEIADRLALLDIACASDERFEPSQVELQIEGPSYSVSTARKLRELHGPEVALYMILGADSLVDLPNWYQISELGELVTFVTVAREGTALDTSPLAKAAGSDCARRAAENLVVVTPHPASSTELRARLAAGEALGDWLPDGVEAELRARGLYGSGGASSRSIVRTDGE